MSILILEEKLFPSAFGKPFEQVIHHKPIGEAIYKLSQTYDFDEDIFHTAYAIDELIQENDTDAVSQKKFNEALDEDRLWELIQPHKVIIALGSKLCEKLTGKKLSKINGKPQEMGEGRIIIPGYSSFYMHKNKRHATALFSLAYQRFTGDYLNRELPGYEIINSINRLKEVIEYRKITGICCFDFETTGLDFYNDETKATVLSLCFQPGYNYIVPIDHKDWIWGDDGDLINVINILNELFSDSNIIKVAHNLKFDYHFLRKYGIELRGRLVDTMLMSHILNEHRKHGLKQLVKEYFPFWSGYEDGVDFDGGLEQLSKYAAIDTDLTLRLFYIFENELLKPGNEKMYRLLRNLVMPSLIALEDIEYRGCTLDRELIIKSIEKAEELLEKKSKELISYNEVNVYVKSMNTLKVQDKINELNFKIESRIQKGKDDSDRYIKKYKEQIRELKTNSLMLYEEVNFNSPSQLAGLLYDGFGFKVPKVNGELKRSTAKEFLNEIDHPFINTLLAYRSISKMLSTYYRGLLERLDVNDRVHGSFLLHGTITGRLSSRNPNLQNIPSRLSFDDSDAKWTLKQVKHFFVPKSEDYYVIQADYSQAELRVIANISGDDTMIKAYLDGEDIHTNTGAMIRGVTLEEFKKLPKEEFKEFRTKAKPANFGWVYKSSLEGYINFAKNMYGVIFTEQEANEHKYAIFNTYPKLLKWHKQYEDHAKKHNYVETLFGRRRRFLNLDSKIPSLVNKDIRDCINNPIQGTAGELTIFCIALLHHRLPTDCKIWCTVHDSVFFYVPKDKLMECLSLINMTCEEPPLYDYFGLKPNDFPVPMKMEYEISDKSWGAMEEIGDFDAVKDLLNEGEDFPNYFEEGLESTF